MALPASIDPTDPTGSASPAQGDDQLRAIKLYLVDVYGAPSATSVTAAAFAVTAGGAVTVSQSPLTVPSVIRGTASQVLRIESQYGQIVLGINGASTLAITPSNLVLNPGVRLFAGQTGLMRADGKLDAGLFGIDNEAQGDLLIRSAGNWGRLAAGTSGQLLRTQGLTDDPVWFTGSALGAITASDNPVTWTGKHTWNGAFNFAFSNPSSLIGLGTSTPTKMLDVRGEVVVGSNLYLGNFVEVTQIPAPSSPSTGLLRLFVTSNVLGTLTFAAKDPAGTVTELNPASFPRAYLAGLTLSNDGSDPTNDIDIAIGGTRSSTNVADLVLNSVLVKRLDAAWAVGTNAGGLDTGAIANTTYHVWLIKRTDTGVVDALFSTSASAPTMPANYTLKRCIGSIIRTGAAIVLFTQKGDEFLRMVPITDYVSTNPGTGAVTRTIAIPTGRQFVALHAITLTDTSSTTRACLVTSLDQTDTAAGGMLTGPHTLVCGSDAINFSPTSTLLEIRTNTSAQFRTRLDASDVSTNLVGTTHGWIDRRGRDD